METKKKINQDAKLIKKHFKFNPLDLARYPDGRLVFISPQGKKFVLTQEEIKELTKSEKPTTKAK